MKLAKENKAFQREDLKRPGDQGTLQNQSLDVIFGSGDLETSLLSKNASFSIWNYASTSPLSSCPLRHDDRNHRHNRFSGYQKSISDDPSKDKL